MISGEGQPLNKAQSSVLERGVKWLWMLCESALRRRGYPDSAYWAEDLSQIVLISLGKLSDEYWDTIKAKEWYVRKIVVNAANQFYNRRKSRPEEGLDFDDFTHTADNTPGFSPDEALNLVDLIEKILRALNDRERVIFYHLLENGGSKNLKELALKLGTSNGAVRQRVVRLRDKIEQLLLDGNEDSPPELGQNSPTEPGSNAISLAILADGYD